MFPGAPRMKKRERWIRAIFIACLPAFVGCASSPARSPSRVALQYASALEKGDAERAWELLGPEARQNISRSQFEKLVRERSPEVLEFAELLRRGASDAQVQAELQMQDGSSVPMTFSGEHWRLGPGAIEFYDLSTPRSALTAFLRAYRRDRFDVMLRLVPDDKKGDLNPDTLKAAWTGAGKLEMDALVAALERSLPTTPIKDMGERASMSYGAGASVQMIYERGDWKIEDFR